MPLPIQSKQASQLCVDTAHMGFPPHRIQMDLGWETWSRKDKLNSIVHFGKPLLSSSLEGSLTIFES